MLYARFRILGLVRCRGQLFTKVRVSRLQLQPRSRTVQRGGPALSPSLIHPSSASRWQAARSAMIKFVAVLIQ
jgi:hypothetical protein